MENKTKLLVFFAPLISITLLNPISILAASNGTVTVLPPRTDISANQGDKIKKTLLLVNSSNNPVILKVSIKDLKSDNSQQSAQKWLVPQYDVISIASLSSAKMDYIVSAGQDMPGKGYGGAILFQLYDPAQKTTSGNVFGTIVTVNVMAKGITTGGTLSNFSAPPFQYLNPAKMAFEINNTGNSNLSLSSTIALSDIFGKKIYESKLDQLEVYPESPKIFNFSLNSNSLLGIYKAELKLTNNMKQENQMSSSAWFLFVPWQKLLLSFLILFAVVILVTASALVYNRVRNKKQKEWFVENTTS